MVYIIYVWIVYIKSLHDQGKNSVVDLCPPCLKMGIMSKAFCNSFSPRSDSMSPVRVVALAGKVLLVIHGEK